MRLLSEKNENLLYQLNGTLDGLGSFEVCWAAITFVAGRHGDHKSSKNKQNENSSQNILFHKLIFQQCEWVIQQYSAKRDPKGFISEARLTLPQKYGF